MHSHLRSCFILLHFCKNFYNLLYFLVHVALCYTHYILAHPLYTLLHSPFPFLSCVISLLHFVGLTTFFNHLMFLVNCAIPSAHFLTPPLHFGTRPYTCHILVSLCCPAVSLVLSPLLYASVILVTLCHTCVITLLQFAPPVLMTLWFYSVTSLYSYYSVLSLLYASIIMYHTHATLCCTSSLHLDTFLIVWSAIYAPIWWGLLQLDVPRAINHTTI